MKNSTHQKTVSTVQLPIDLNNLADLLNTSFEDMMLIEQDKEDAFRDILLKHLNDLNPDAPVSAKTFLDAMKLLISKNNKQKKESSESTLDIAKLNLSHNGVSFAEFSKHYLTKLFALACHQFEHGNYKESVKLYEYVEKLGRYIHQIAEDVDADVINLNRARLQRARAWLAVQNGDLEIAYAHACFMLCYAPKNISLQADVMKINNWYVDGSYTFELPLHHYQTHKGFQKPILFDETALTIAFQVDVKSAIPCNKKWEPVENPKRLAINSKNKPKITTVKYDVANKRAMVDIQGQLCFAPLTILENKELAQKRSVKADTFYLIDPHAGERLSYVSYTKSQLCTEGMDMANEHKVFWNIAEYITRYGMDDAINFMLKVYKILFINGANNLSESVRDYNQAVKIFNKLHLQKSDAPLNDKSRPLQSCKVVMGVNDIHVHLLDIAYIQICQLLGNAPSEKESSSSIMKYDSYFPLLSTCLINEQNYEPSKHVTTLYCQTHSNYVNFLYELYENSNLDATPPYAPSNSTRLHTFDLNQHYREHMQFDINMAKGFKAFFNYDFEEAAKLFKYVDERRYEPIEVEDELYIETIEKRAHQPTLMICNLMCMGIELCKQGDLEGAKFILEEVFALFPKIKLTFQTTPEQLSDTSKTIKTCFENTYNQVINDMSAKPKVKVVLSSLHSTTVPPQTQMGPYTDIEITCGSDETKLDRIDAIIEECALYGTERIRQLSVEDLRDCYLRLEHAGRNNAASQKLAKVTLEEEARRKKETERREKETERREKEAARREKEKLKRQENLKIEQERSKRTDISGLSEVLAGGDETKILGYFNNMAPEQVAGVISALLDRGAYEHFSEFYKIASAKYDLMQHKGGAYVVVYSKLALALDVTNEELASVTQQMPQMSQSQLQKLLQISTSTNGNLMQIIAKQMQDFSVMTLLIERDIVKLDDIIMYVTESQNNELKTQLLEYFGKNKKLLDVISGENKSALQKVEQTHLSDKIATLAEAIKLENCAEIEQLVSSIIFATNVKDNLLLQATMQGKASVVETLLRLGANPYYVNATAKLSAFKVAVKAQKVALLQLFFAKYSAEHKHVYGPMLEYAQEYDESFIELYRFMKVKGIEIPAGITTSDVIGAKDFEYLKENRDLIISFIKEDKITEFEKAIKPVLDPKNLEDVLEMAAEADKIKFVEALLNAGVRADVMEICIRKNHVEVLKLVLEKIQTEVTVASINSAAEHGHMELAKVMLMQMEKAGDRYDYSKLAKEFIQHLDEEARTKLMVKGKEVYEQNARDAIYAEYPSKIIALFGSIYSKQYLTQTVIFTVFDDESEKNRCAKDNSQILSCLYLLSRGILKEYNGQNVLTRIIGSYNFHTAYMTIKWFEHTGVSTEYRKGGDASDKYQVYQAECDKLMKQAKLTNPMQILCLSATRMNLNCATAIAIPEYWSVEANVAKFVTPLEISYNISSGACRKLAEAFKQYLKTLASKILEL